MYGFLVHCVLPRFHAANETVGIPKGYWVNVFNPYETVGMPKGYGVNVFNVIYTGPMYSTHTKRSTHDARQVYT